MGSALKPSAVGEIVVHNHNPVPLRPLREVLLESSPGEPVYVQALKPLEGSAYEYGQTGWLTFLDNGDYVTELHMLDRQISTDDVDWYATMARRLQPGEILTVSYTRP